MLYRDFLTISSVYRPQACSYSRMSQLSSNQHIKSEWVDVAKLVPWLFITENPLSQSAVADAGIVKIKSINQSKLVKWS